MISFFSRLGKPVPAVLTAADSTIYRFKAEVFRLVNMERRKNGIAELKGLDAIAVIADIRAKEACSQFSHTRPDGTRCFTIFTEYAFKYRAAGENLAFGYKTPMAVVTAWMKSEGHRRNILDPDFEYAKIGYYVNENRTVYCSTLFYTPKADK